MTYLNDQGISVHEAGREELTDAQREAVREAAADIFDLMDLEDANRPSGDFPPASDSPPQGAQS